jgi:hypothetical protein
VHDALGDPLVIEVLDLLDQREVFEQGRSAFAGAQGILVVGDRDADVGGEGSAGGIYTNIIEQIAYHAACFLGHGPGLPGESTG